jgi:hypothetical protein
MRMSMQHDGINWTIALFDEEHELLAKAEGFDERAVLQAARDAMKAKLGAAALAVPDWLDKPLPPREPEDLGPPEPDEDTP